jgi:AAA+ superfamily predicted ATPase
MHHEDRAGVNALIRGIDDLAASHLPVAVIMCTNRLGALDPAVRRRAAVVFEFHRPNKEQRLAVLRDGLDGSGLAVGDLTGRSHGRTYGFTYSDLTQRLIPSLVLDAFPTNPITASRALEVLDSVLPTPPFEDKAHAPRTAYING